MTTYSISAPDGNTYRIDGPAGATQDQVQAEVMKQHPQASAAAPRAAKPTAIGRTASAIGKLSPTGPAAAATVGAAEAALHTGTGMLASIPAGAASAYELATSPAGSRVQNARQAASSVQSALTYQPRTAAGQAGAAGVDKVLGLLPALGEKAGMGVTHLTGSAGAGAAVDLAVQSIPILLGAKVGSKMTADAVADNAADSARTAARAVHYVQTKTGLNWRDLSDSFKNSLMSIANDAKDLDRLDPAAVEREGRAASQPVSVPVSRGNATRDLAQVTREESIRKSDAGAPLRDIMASQDQALYQNLDVMRGAVAPGSKVKTTADVGASVQGALRSKLAAKRADKNAAYDAAKSSGALKAPADPAPLFEWLQTPANARNSSWLASALRDYTQTSGKDVPAGVETSPVLDASGKPISRPVPAQKSTRTMTINDLEEIRKEATARAMGPPTADTHYAGEVRKVIDGILDQSGGDAYQKARAANAAYKGEFDRQGLIRKLVGSKGRTTDRAIALEDTLQHVVVRGSNADLATVKKSLLTDDKSGKGASAWADLQAGSIDYLKQAAGGRRAIEGERGQAQFNGAFLDALHDLDRDGKLDTLFGPFIADRVRLFAKTVHDVRTTPAGRISGSDSIPRIINLLDKAKVIPGVGHVVRGTAEIVRKVYQRGKQASEAQESARGTVAARAAKGRAQAAAESRNTKAARRLIPADVAAAEGSQQP